MSCLGYSAMTLICWLCLLHQSRARQAQKLGHVCNQTLGAYNHVSGGDVIDLQKLVKYELKEWDLGKKWGRLVHLTTAKLPLNINGISQKAASVSWSNVWEKKSTEGELCVYIQSFNNSAICIHPMHLQARQSTGLGRLYLLNRDQNKEVQQFVDAVFKCKEKKLSKYLFMDAGCVKTTQEESVWRIILGTTARPDIETWLAVIYGSQGEFKGEQYVSNKYSGKLQWKGSASSIHVMSLTGGVKADPSFMQYRSYTSSARCKPIQSRGQYRVSKHKSAQMTAQ